MADLRLRTKEELRSGRTLGPLLCTQKGRTGGRRKCAINYVYGAKKNNNNKQKKIEAHTYVLLETVV